ncbi:hypothetical protein F441_02434, partial [Phytophthora nicotianae CJ01A1]
ASTPAKLKVLPSPPSTFCRLLPRGMTNFVKK